MSEYNWTTTDDDDEHGERYGVQALTVEYDTRTGRALAGTEAEAPVEGETATSETATEGATRATPTVAGGAGAKLATVRVKVICSCGYYTCGMIRRYGHPEPLYRSDIRPLPSQYARDRRALELHGNPTGLISATDGGPRA